MGIEPTRGHTVKAYDSELAQLRGLVLEMGERVVEQVTDAVAAVVEGDPDPAHEVVNRERKIDYFELDVDESIFTSSRGASQQRWTCAWSWPCPRSWVTWSGPATGRGHRRVRPAHPGTGWVPGCRHLSPRLPPGQAGLLHDGAGHGCAGRTDVEQALDVFADDRASPTRWPQPCAT